MRGARTIPIRSFVGAIVVALGTSVSAQQPIPDTPDIAKVRLQVKNFEMALRNAVEAGAQGLAEEANTVFPGAIVAFSSDPVVIGWQQPGVGYSFFVEVPGILPVTLLTMRQQPVGPLPPSDRAVPITPTPATTSRTTAVPGKVTGAAMPEPDPMRPAATPATFDPERVYSDRVREAIIDALLDSSKSLPFKDNDRVSVTAAPAPLPYPNPLEPRRKMLIVQIAGVDLAAFHRGEITKDEAKRRIVESRF